jgi:hypothetical protein
VSGTLPTLVVLGDGRGSHELSMRGASSIWKRQREMDTLKASAREQRCGHFDFN